MASLSPVATAAARILRRRIAPLLAIVAPLACSEADAHLSQRQVRVVATTSMITDAVRTVGGDRVQVTGLMGPGVDPHLYKASEGDVRDLARADIIFYNGLHLEAKMAEVLERVRGRIKTVAVTDGIDRAVLLAPPEFKGAYDPHVWFDVRLWMQAVERVRDALVELDSTHAERYRRNAEQYLNELEELDGYVRAQVATIPERQRVLVTAHDAFNYFGRAYGFEVRGLQGISTATEAGTADVQALADFIAARRIPAIFVESSVPRRTIEAVQAAVRARGFDVQIGGQLYSDAMGNPGTPEGTYVGMVRHNTDTIVRALRGPADWRAGGPAGSDGRGARGALRAARPAPMRRDLIPELLRTQHPAARTPAFAARRPACPPVRPLT